MTVTETKSPQNLLANKAIDPCTLVIFGATGDLTKRLLIPALCNLASRKLLPTNFAILGAGRSEITDDEFRSRLTADIKAFATTKIESELWQWVLRKNIFCKNRIRLR